MLLPVLYMGSFLLGSVGGGGEDRRVGLSTVWIVQEITGGWDLGLKRSLCLLLHRCIIICIGEGHIGQEMRW